MSDRRDDGLLEQALAEIAQEDAGRLRDDLRRDPALRSAADAAFARGQKRLLPRLRRGRGPRVIRLHLLQAAASIVLLVGAWYALQQPIRDLLKQPDPLASGTPTALHHTLAPRTTEPAHTLPPQTAAPRPTPQPDTPAPSTPAITQESTQAPKPTASASLTPVPFTPEPTQGAPAWPGRHFVPAGTKGFTLTALTGLSAGAQASFTDSQGNAYTFTEHDHPALPAPGPGAQLAYALLKDGSVALTAEGSSGAQVIWDTDGRTLSVFTRAGIRQALALANAIEKIQ